MSVDKMCTCSQCTLPGRLFITAIIAFITGIIWLVCL
jgi:hypothetical protein